MPFASPTITILEEELSDTLPCAPKKKSTLSLHMLLEDCITYPFQSEPEVLAASKYFPITIANLAEISISNTSFNNFTLATHCCWKSPQWTPSKDIRHRPCLFQTDPLYTSLGGPKWVPCQLILTSFNSNCPLWVVRWNFHPQMTHKRCSIRPLLDPWLRKWALPTLSLPNNCPLQYPCLEVNRKTIHSRTSNITCPIYTEIPE